MSSDKFRDFIFLISALFLPLLNAGEHLVISNGKSKAYSTPAKALAKAKTGDTVIIDNGFWYGGLKMKTPGVTLKGKEKTVIFAGTKVDASAWKAAPEAGKNAWKTSWKQVPDTIVCNGRFLLELHPNNGNGTFSYKEIMKYGVGSTGRALLGGIFSYDRKSKYVTVSLADIDDISKCTIVISARSKDALTIAADNCTASNLTLVGGEAGAAFRNANNSEIHHILALANKNGILFTDNSSNCSAHHCDTILNPDSFSSNAKSGPHGAYWDIWLAHKRVGSWDKTGIAIFWAGKGNQIYSNTVYNHWNGIHCGTNPKTWNKGLKEYYQNFVAHQKGRVNQSTIVRNNRIDLCCDDGIEPSGDVQDNRWHSNIVTRAHCGLRIKVIDIGPLYLYDNEIYDCLDGIRFFKAITEPAQVYLFHNKLQHRVAHSLAGVETIPLKGALGKAVPAGVKGGNIHNNLYITDNYTKAFPKPGTALFSASHNAYSCSRPAELPENIDRNSRFNLKIDSGAAICKEVKAEKLDKKLIAESGKYAGLLSLAREETPNSFVSGRYEYASKIFDMKLRKWKKSPLYIRRFIRGAKQNYIITNSKKADTVKLVLYAYLMPKKKDSGVRVTFSDNKGIFGEKQLKFLSVQEIDIPAKGREKIRVSLISKRSDASWALDAANNNISCELLLDEPLEIMAGDDVSPIKISTRITNSTEVIGVKATPLFEQKEPFVWIRPDGRKIPLPADGKVNSEKIPGVWILQGGNCRRVRFEAVKSYPAPLIRVHKADINNELEIRTPPPGFPE